MKIKSTSLTILVSNMDKSIAFYEQLGFALQERWQDHYAELTAPGIKIGLHPSNNIKANPNHMSLGIIAENFEECKTALSQLGITFTERKEEGGNFIHLNDPDGAPIYFIEPKW